MSKVDAKNFSSELPTVDGLIEKEDTITFASLLRKVAAFTIVIFLFHLAVPLPAVNGAIISALGIEYAWYREIPVAVCVAVLNAAFALMAFRLVR